MNQNQQTETGKRIVAAMALVGMGVLAGCAGVGDAPEQFIYRCENGMEFTARFTDDSAVLKGPHTDDVLLRDAGGQGEQQAVFSSARLRAQFGLGASAREALLQYAEPQLVVRCLRD